MLVNSRLDKEKPFSYGYSIIFVCFILAGANLFRTPAWSADVIEYQNVYDLIIGGTVNSFTDFVQLSFEPGFIILALATGFVTSSVNLLLFFFGFTSLIIKLSYIQRRYVRKDVSLIILYSLTYFILLELTQSRIAIASAILLVGYHFLARQMPGKFLLMVVVATMFHYSALVGLLALIFYNQSGLDAVKRNLIVIAVLAFSAYALRSSAVFELIQIVDAKKASYLTSADTDQGSGIIRVGIVVLYQSLILAVTRPAVLRAAESSVMRFHALIFNLYVISISIYLTLNSFGVVAVRLAEVFRNVEPFLLAIALSHCSPKKKPILWGVFFIAICVNLQKNNSAIFPDGF